jgi:phage shock protein C
MSMNRHLFRSREDRMLAGVAGGLAELWDADPSLVRIVWALLVVLTGGIALVVYIVMAIVVPDEDALRPTDASGGADQARVESREMRRRMRAERRAQRGSAGRSGGVVIGVLLILVGFWYLVREYLPSVDWDWFWPLTLVCLGVFVLVLAVRPRSPHSGIGGPDGSGVA